VTLEERVGELAADVRPADAAAAAAAAERLAGLATPPGGLGRLGAVAVRLAAVTGRCPPPVPTVPAVVVAAGDHGVIAQGVSAWPQEVTAAIVAGALAGRAAVSAIARSVGAQVAVLDVGVATPLPDSPGLRRARVRAGTADLSSGPAMTREEAARALLAGAGLAEELVSGGADLLVPGEMGIANTTPAAALVAVFTGRPAAEVTGPGAGADDAALARKTATVAAALARHRPDPADPLGVLAAVGGLEHAALAGVILSGAADGVPVVLDGVSSAAAALVAAALAPAVTGRLIAGHRSAEPGCAAALATLDLDPVLDLGLRLGEGTGGLLAVPLVQAAARALAETALLADVTPT